MRRLASSLIAASGLALLAACSGGGYGFSANNGSSSLTPTVILFENGSASVNDFFLDPTGNAPVLVSALAIKGTGSGSVVIPDQTFTWAAVYAAAGTTYSRGASPNGNGVCGAAPSNFPINSLLMQGAPQAAFSAYPLYGGFFSQLLAQPPPGSGPVGSFPTYTQRASQIYVGVPLTPGAASPFIGTTPIVPSALAANYCITVQATHSSGLVGTTTVVVSQAP